MVYFVVDISVLLVIWACSSTTVFAETKCETCRSIVTKFKEGIENTAKSNFGGGNTNWEERKLGTYAFSETRLLEILDHSCSDNKECHYMLEENEEVIENWWFQHYAKTKEYNLLEYFCIDAIKVCCQDGFYGKDCSSCPGDTSRPCTGNGKCQGSGTREGKGDCSCNAGYIGDLCADCSGNYFQQTKNDTHSICIACHRACNTTCRGENADDCDDCSEGWARGESGGCSDINECEETSSESKLCSDSQICVNNEGSYTCKACDLSCASCTGEGPEHCTTCSTKYFMDNQVCRKCHKSCSSSCTDDTPMTCDECASGWIKDEQLGCKDIDECVEGVATCKEDTYCENTDGYHLCKACHKSCRGCQGPAPTDCTVCQQGYKLNEQNECADIDECVVDVNSVCTGVGEKCINNIGSYKCECHAEYTFVRGKCQLKNKGTKKKKKETTAPADSKLPPIITSPEDADAPKRFQGKLEESMKGFQQIMKDLGQDQAKPINGKPMDDHVTMEGIFKDGVLTETSRSKTVDNKMPKNIDNETNKKRTDFVKDDL